MVRTLVLIVSSASIILVGYVAYTYQDRGTDYSRTELGGVPPAEATVTGDGAALQVNNYTVRGGTKPYVVVYDADGEPKYQFRSTKWEPVSDLEFDLVHPEICIFMPGGEITRIEADQGRVFVERPRGNNLNPKRGRLHGNVRIFIDRTDKAWRRSNPELVAPEKHADRIVKIWMDDLRFDLDQSYIKSEGKLRVQSTEVEIEGKGLTLAWNERDNRIEELVIEAGRYMELRRGGSLVSFGMPGEERDVDEPTTRPSTPEEKDHARQVLKRAAAMSAAGAQAPTKKAAHPSPFIRQALAQRASANQALSMEDVYPTERKQAGPIAKRTGRFSDKPAKPRRKVRLFGPSGDDRLRPKQRKTDTYLAVFEKGVVVEQRRGMKMLGRLGGVERLEMIFDVSDKQRRAISASGATSRPAETATQPAEAAERPDEEAVAKDGKGAPTSQPEDRTRLRLLWSGRLVMKPVDTGEEAQRTGKRFDVRAVGPEVRIWNKQGEVVCKQLIFSNETEQAWLYGDSKRPVRMWSEETRRLSGREIYLDRKTGIAVVNGAGSMSDTRQGLAQIAIPGAGDSDAEGGKKLEDERIEISWGRQVELDFSAATVTRVDPETGREVTRRREYVKESSFRGGVRMKQGEQFIKAEEISMVMGVPTNPKDFVGPILAVRASGGVSLMHQKDEIRSEKLSVTMAVDEDGRNVPKSATAYGNVSAKQRDRHIMAKDMLSVVIAPTAAPAPTTQTTQPRRVEDIDPAQLAKIKQAAAMQGIPASEIDALLRTQGLNVAALKAFAVSKKIPPKVIDKLLKPKKPKPRLAIVEMHAFGDVVAVDPKERLDVKAEELHCVLPDGKNIEQATVIAKPNDQSRAEFGDYVIHGHRIEIDMPRQFAEVPDKGWLRFLSRQGLDGRQLDKPVPTKVSWSKEMRLEGKKNVGRFVGDVVAESQTSRLDCDRLRIDFVDLPPALQAKAEKKPPPSKFEVVRDWLLRKPKSSSDVDSPTGRFRQRFDKKPIGVLAEGNVVVVSSMFDKDDARRLLSRLRISGPKLTVDLLREQLEVIGSGSLLIEDYRLPLAKGAIAAKPPSRPKDPLMGDLSGRGPSQTLFSWANSMSYFLSKNLAVLDRSVSMVHQGGRSMVMAESLARAVDADISQLRLKGREAALTCETLTVEFLRSAGSSKGSTPFDRAGSAELKRLIATGNIYLEDSGRSLVGEELTYFRDKNEITVWGSKQKRARLFVEDGKSGEVFIYDAPLIRWNRNTGDIHAPGARLYNAGR